MHSMAVCNYVVSVLGLLIGACIMHAAAAFPLEFTENGPGAGFWPFALGAALAAAAAALFLATMWQKDFLSREMVRLTAVQNRRVYLMMLLAALYCLLLRLLGFYPASLLLIPAVMRLMDYRDKKYIALTTAATLLFIYLVFGLLLHTQMPQSLLLE